MEVTKDEIPAKRGLRRAVAGALVMAVSAVAIIGLSTGLISWSSRAIVIGIQLPLLVLLFWVLGERPPGLVWAVVPGISGILAVIFLGRAVLDLGHPSAPASLAVCLFFAIHSACACLACLWASRVGAAPPDLRAKGAEALRLLSLPLVLGVILAVVPDALGDEFFVPFLSALGFGSLVIIFGSGYTSAVSAREEWKRRSEAKHATSSVNDDPSDAREPGVPRWLGLALLALVGLRTLGRESAIRDEIGVLKEERRQMQRAAQG